MFETFDYQERFGDLEKCCQCEITSIIYMNSSSAASITEANQIESKTNSASMEVTLKMAIVSKKVFCQNFENRMVTI